MRCRINQCHACCCYNIPFAAHELERFSSLIVTPVIRQESIGGGMMAFTNEDPLKNHRPFLRKDYTCNIYESRPEICRLFGEIEELTCKFRR